MSELDDSKIDLQHDAIDKMIEDIKAITKKGIDRNKVSRMLTVFTKLLRSHFDNEDRYMMAKGYRLFQSHKNDHTRVVETLTFLISDMNLPERLPARMNSFMRVRPRALTDFSPCLVARHSCELSAISGFLNSQRRDSLGAERLDFQPLQIAAHSR